MKYRYLTIDEDGTPYGFNDAALILEVAEFQAVWDLETGEVHATWGDADKEAIKIKELKRWEQSED